MKVELELRVNDNDEVECICDGKPSDIILALCTAMDESTTLEQIIKTAAKAHQMNIHHE